MFIISTSRAIHEQRTARPLALLKHLEAKLLLLLLQVVVPTSLGEFYGIHFEQ